MKTKTRNTKEKAVALLCALFFLFLPGGAQVSSESIRQFLSAENFSSLPLRRAAQVKAFYEQVHYRPVWLSAGGSTARTNLFAALQSAADLALEEKEYQYTRVQKMRLLPDGFKSQRDSLEAEVCLTDAALHLWDDVQNGNQPPSLGYNGLGYKPANDEIPAQLARCLQEHQLADYLSEAEPSLPAYHHMRQLLATWNKTQRQPDFREVTVLPQKQDTAGETLRKRLHQLGLLPAPATAVADSILVRQLKEAQRLFNLTADGKAGPKTVQALNVPLRQRRSALQQAINHLRWLNGIITTGPVVLVNIPSATLLLYNKGQVLLESRIIAGKPATPTPLLSSKITEIVLYPYWNVPHKIATRELLPKIKRNLAYLERNNYQILNRNGRVLNPYAINWSLLSTGYFPYFIRQSTGCDNALGIVKLNFYNPFAVYLHDTPGKGLFAQSRRFFSHGCMRVEEALELARLLLPGHTATLDSLVKKGCLHQQAPVVLPAVVQAPVFVLYSTVWFNRQGRLTFYEDVYHRLKEEHN